MRLTLRNMLAHMDDILSPEDAEQIGKKIEESEYASGLLHRIRDCMRRLRLGAPKVLDEGKGLDPNTVAEYLDNAMPADQVGDFEKICLESDVHLAEVASCHQILTMVLGEPAEVDPESRQRLYKLGTEEAAQPAASSVPAEAPDREAPESGASAEPKAEDSPRESKAKLPDYLREAQSQRRRTRLIVAVILILALGVGLLLGSGKHKSLLAALGLGSEQSPSVEQPSSPVPPPAGPTTDPLPASDAGPVAEPTDAAMAPGGATASVEPSLPEPPAAEPEAVASIPVEPPTGVVPEPPVAGATDPPADASGDPAPVPSELVGQFASTEQMEVLLKLDPSSGTWWRLPPEASLGSGDELIAIPTYRPTIVLKEAIRLTLVEGTQVRLLPTDGQDVPGVAVERGRLILGAVNGAEARLRLQQGHRTGVIHFVDAASEVAVEVYRPGLMTTDPEIEPLPQTSELFVLSGQVTWKEEPVGEPITVTGQQRLRLDQEPSQVAAIEELPAWVATPRLSELERRASETVQGRLTQEKSAALALLELADHRQREVRRLALRCLGTIGDYRPLVEALDDADHKMVWPDYFSVEQLVAAIAAGPESATAVRRVMEELHRSDGIALYEMLWQHHSDEVTREDARRLVEYLDHDTLAMRRLSFWNLRRLNGGAGYYYEPEDPAAERRTKVPRWKQWADKIKADEEEPEPDDKGGVFPPEEGSI